MDPITEAVEVRGVEVPESTKRRWGSTNVVLAVGIVVGLVAATVFGVLALGAGSDADAARQRTGTLRDRMSVLEGRALVAQQRRDRLTELRTTAANRMDDLGTALDQSEAAQNAYVEISNRGADQHNAGDPGAAAATFRGEGQTAFDQLAGNVAAADRALVAVQDSIHDLEEELR